MSAERRPAPWRGKPRVPDPRVKFIAVRCKKTEYEQIDALAKQAGLSIGAYLRAEALGNAGVRAHRRPTIEYQTLAQALGHLGWLGSNVNQLAHVANTNGETPSVEKLAEMTRDIRAMRAALMKALGRGDQG